MKNNTSYDNTETSIRKIAEKKCFSFNFSLKIIIFEKNTLENLKYMSQKFKNTSDICLKHFNLRPFTLNSN